VIRAKPTVSSRRALPVLLLALLACVAAIFGSRPAAAGAAGAHRSCASAKARGGSRACSSRKRSTRAHHKSGRRKTGHRRSKKSHPSNHGGSAHGAPAVPATEPALCEDGSTPVREASGVYGCGDGSEPACSDGSEPIASKRSSQPECPLAAEEAAEWSEATCDDGSSPSRTSDGGYVCEDGSAPECEDGSSPTLREGRSTPSCLESGSGEPAPSGSGFGEGEEEPAEDAVVSPSGRAASAS
jgi:hypothetical protein